MKSAMWASWSETSAWASTIRITTLASRWIAGSSPPKISRSPRKPSPAAHARGIDQHILATAAFEIDLDGIAGGARCVEGDDPLFTEQGVDQVDFADVRSPDDGDAHGIRILPVLFRRKLSRAISTSPRTPSPWRAEIAFGSPGRVRGNQPRPCRNSCPSALLTATKTGRSMRATCWRFPCRAASGRYGRRPRK